MNKKDIMIILGTAHLTTTPGKRSPDGRFREALYSRERCRGIAAKLREYGYNVAVDYDDEKLPKTMQTPSVKLEQQRELGLRVNLVNQLCKKFYCIYVSIHNDAIGDDGKWHTSGGFSVFTSPGVTKSDKLAECLYDAAEKNLTLYKQRFYDIKKKGGYGEKQQPIRTDKSDGDRDFESKLYVLTKTDCTAVLTENLFQDNKHDVDFLLSDEGIHAIERLHVEGIISYLNTLK